MRTSTRAFTIVEMLVVISIIGLLAGLLLPAISGARDQARVSASESNLRQLGVAHANYAGEWNDRQFTLTRDDIAAYGLGVYGDCALSKGPVGSAECLTTILLVQGEDPEAAMPPPITLGWSMLPGSANRSLTVLTITDSTPSNYALLAPIVFEGPTGGADDKEKFGYFRLPNARAFGQYLSGRFFDKVFYAPKDRAVMEMHRTVEDDPTEFPHFCLLYDDPPIACPSTIEQNYGWGSTDFCYSSYSLSPAALFSPDVMRNKGEGGFQDPWDLPAGMRAPAMSQALFPGLKTHMLEHHWLQGAKAECNPEMVEARNRPYQDCQPYFFNQALSSAPVTLFYDGHVQLVGVNQAQLADGRMSSQTDDWGLWSRDTPFGMDGYWQSRSFDDPDTFGTSFHILTTDGIRGRDVFADGG